MPARSTTRAAGGILLLGLVLSGSTGCFHSRYAIVDCRPKATAPCPPAPACPPPATAAADCPPVCESKPCPTDKCPAPCPSSGKPCVLEVRDCAPTIQKAPQQTVEVREAPPVHVKVPQQTVYVEGPPEVPAAPTPPAVPPGYGQPATVNHVPAGRSRLGFTFDFVRVPFPILRPIAVPTSPEVTYTVPAAPVGFVSQPVAPVGFVQQPVAPAYAAPVAPPVYAQPVAPPQVVPVQPVAPPQVQYVPVQPQVPQLPTQPVSPQTAEDYCRQVDALIKALEASKAAAGCKK